VYDTTPPVAEAFVTTPFVAADTVVDNVVTIVWGAVSTNAAWLASNSAFIIDCVGTTWSLVWINLGIAPLRYD
jgi:hypothetical protein